MFQALAWILVLLELLCSNTKMIKAIVLAVLMISYHFSSIVVQQAYYFFTLYEMGQQPKIYKQERSCWFNVIGLFVGQITFIVSLWLFSFDYWRMSYKLKLLIQKKPIKTNKCLLKTINFLVTTIIFGICFYQIFCFL